MKTKKLFDQVVQQSQQEINRKEQEYQKVLAEKKLCFKERCMRSQMIHL